MITLEVVIALVLFLFFFLTLIMELKARNFLLAEGMQKVFNVLVVIIILLIVSSIFIFRDLY